MQRLNEGLDRTPSVGIKGQPGPIICGVSLPDWLHFSLTVSLVDGQHLGSPATDRPWHLSGQVVIWVAVVLLAALLDDQQVMVLVSCVSGYGASLLAFILPVGRTRGGAGRSLASKKASKRLRTRAGQWGCGKGAARDGSGGGNTWVRL